MSVVKKNRVIPKLRFKDFNDEWKLMKLGELFKINAGGDISKENVSNIKTENFKYPIYANAKAAKGFYAYSDIYKSESNVVTVAGRGVNLGIAHARKEKFFPIVRLLVMKPLSKCNIDYFEHRINLIRLFIESTGVPQLTAPQLSNYIVSFPSFEEQNKIAEFLSSVDKKIQLLEKKKEQLELYKKGVMQKIFSREIRFKDDNGNSYPDWEEKNLGDICDIKKGKQLNKSELTESGSHPCINGGVYPSGYTENWNRNENTITISEGGNSCGYVNYLKTKFWCGGHCYSLLNIIDQIIDTFLFQSLKHNEEKIMRLRVGSGLPNIQIKEVSKYGLSLPIVEEQKKIADFLSAIDSKIETTSTQIDKTKEFKKGLLQQMFV